MERRRRRTARAKKRRKEAAIGAERCVARRRADGFGRQGKSNKAPVMRAQVVSDPREKEVEGGAGGLAGRPAERIGPGEGRVARAGLGRKD